MEEISIPEYIDNPPQILFLELDDLFPWFFSVFLGLVADLIMGTGYFFFIGVVVGFVFVRIYIGFKRNQLPGTLKAFIYNHTGIFPMNKKFNNGLLKRVVE